MSGNSYISHPMSAATAIEQTCDQLSRAAYERHAGPRGTRIERFPILPNDAEIRLASGQWEARKLATGEAEGDLVGVQGSMFHFTRIGKVDADAAERLIRRAESRYVDAMEEQMLAWAQLQAAVAVERGSGRLGFRWQAGVGAGYAAPSPFLAVP